MQCASHLNLGWRINMTDTLPMSTTVWYQPFRAIFTRLAIHTMIMKYICERIK